MRAVKGGGDSAAGDDRHVYVSVPVEVNFVAATAPGFVAAEGDIENNQWPIDVATFTTRLLAPARDAGPAQWLIDSLRWEYTVISQVTDRFEAYARVFHPARLTSGRPSTESAIRRLPNNYTARRVTWREVAEANATTMHPAAEWGSLVGTWDLNDSQPGLWNRVPDREGLDLSVARALSTTLARFTTTPDRAWFAIWVGHGAPPGPPEFELPGRQMQLFTGPVTAPWLPDTATADSRVDDVCRWWPDDQAWCVAGDVDLMSTYIGGTRECIDAVLATPGIEVLEVPPEQTITIDTDTINPRPPDY